MSLHAHVPKTGRWSTRVHRTKHSNYCMIEITPLDDSQEHNLGDECWCMPKTESMTATATCVNGHQHAITTPIIVHNSADGRERTEEL